MGTKRLVRLFGALAVVLVVAVMSGCVRVDLPESDSLGGSDQIEISDATEVSAEIDMGAGKLSVAGGAEDLMDAEYEYTRSAWRPEVDYAVNSGQGRLTVRQPSDPGVGLGGNYHYVWDIALSDTVPLDLSVNMGAGEADLDLRGMDLRSLRVNLGAGDTTIDMSGSWAHDVTANVNAGAGSLTLRVPADVGVRIVGYQDGLGSYRADGFAQDGEALVNDAYESADVRFDIVLRRGLGDVTVETVE